MKQVTNRHFGVAGGLFLLIALALTLAFASSASAGKHRIVSDGTAPVTSDNAAAMVGLPFSLTFTATDSGSGVQATFYRIDGGAWIDDSVVSIQLHERHSRTGLMPGAHVVEYYSIDNAGNVEAVQDCMLDLVQ